MDAILGKKIGMTQVFTTEGDCVPVTVVQVERCVPVLKRTQEKNGYEAVLVAYGDRKAKHTSKPLAGFYKKIGQEPARHLRELRDQELDDEALGQQLKVDMFAEGEKVDVLGVSKGKGFQGVMKRHGFAGHPASRGNHESFRGAGSIGQATFPGRVHRGHKMPGQMGNENVFVKNLKVVRVDAGNNVILLRGAGPGKNGGIVRISKSGKQGK